MDWAKIPVLRNVLRVLRRTRAHSFAALNAFIDADFGNRPPKTNLRISLTGLRTTRADR